MKKSISIIFLGLLMAFMNLSCSKESSMVPVDKEGNSRGLRKPAQVYVYPLKNNDCEYSYEQLTEADAQWVFGTEPGTTILNDPDGTMTAAAKQPFKNVTMLPSNWGGVSTRSLTIPANKPVFVPIVHGTSWGYDNDACDPTFKPAPGQTWRQYLQTYVESVTTVTDFIATLDGNDIVPDVSKYLLRSELFSIKIDPAYNYPDCDYSHKKSHVISDGYSLLMKLPKGKHVLRYAARWPANDAFGEFYTEIIWNLDIK